MDTKYIFVTGGVVSSLGKGIIAASIGKLLQARGYRITIQKFDPYINIDPGTLNPYEHGECYVTEDGFETDLDLGHYERFTGIRTTRNNSVTTGRIYKTVIDRERRGDYLGKTIQVVPHITDEIKRRMMHQASPSPSLLRGETEGGRDVELHNTTDSSISLCNQTSPPLEGFLPEQASFGRAGEALDFVITEVGGTIGDIESAPFMEAIRQLRWELGRNAVCVHLTYVPYLKAADELKTKPTQHSVKELQSMGIQPDILVLRTERHLSDDLRRKVAHFCNVDLDCVVQSEDMPSIYEVPVSMQQQGLDAAILRKTGKAFPCPSLLQGETEGSRDVELHYSVTSSNALGNQTSPPSEGFLPGQASFGRAGEAFSSWHAFLEKQRHATRELHIGLVGKYDLQDAYKSIRESLNLAGIYNDVKAKPHFVNSEEITPQNIGEKLDGLSGIIICPGFGQRGIEGKIVAAEYARTHDIPTFGICLGMQMMAIEFARNVLGYQDANSTEFAQVASLSGHEAAPLSGHEVPSPQNLKTSNLITSHPVIDLMEEQKNISQMGGTMRLGAYDCQLKKESRAWKAYGEQALVRERHRHRYEFNNAFREEYEQAGMKCVGINPAANLVEIVEIPTLRWYIGTQFHPEYSSTVLHPHPLFMSFIKSCIEGKDRNEEIFKTTN